MGEKEGGGRRGGGSIQDHNIQVRKSTKRWKIFKINEQNLSASDENFEFTESKNHNGYLHEENYTKAHCNKITQNPG